MRRSWTPLLSIPLLASVICLSTSAHAEETKSTSEKATSERWPVAKSVTVYGLGGLAVVGLGYATVRYIQLDGARATQGSDFPRNARGEADCTTAQQCEELKRNSDDRQSYLTHFAIGMTTFGLATVGALLAASLWPNESTKQVRLLPSATQHAGSLALVGAF